MKKKIREWDASDVQLLVGLILLVVCVTISVSLLKRDVFDPAKEISTETVQLRTINLDNQTSGPFVFGCGSLKNNSYYACYEVLEDGGLKLAQYPTSVTIIYETLKENETAYAEVSVNGLGKVVGVKMYIPENSIQTEYSFTE